MHLLSAISVLFVGQTLVYWTKQGLCSENDPPDIHFTKEPPSQVDFSNNTGTSVECKAAGSTPTSITWIFLDGTPVPKIQGLRKVTPDDTLIFSPFNSQAFRQDVHAVVYKCMATNIAGTLVSRDVKVKAVMDVDYDSNIYDVFAIRGNPAVIKCHVPTFLQDYVSVVSYIKDDSLKIASTPDTETKYTLASHGALYIKDVGSMDAGTNYKCQTYHRLTGKMRTSSSSGKLFVTDPHGNIPPRIVDSVTMLQVNLGENSLLPCVANGYPLPKTSWFTKHGGQLLSLKSENRVRISAHGLIISNVQLADAGTYVCQVNSTVGNDQSEMTFIVNEPLKVSVNPVKQRVNIGDPFSLKCDITGYPVQSVTWTKNGEPINPQRVQKIDNHSVRVNAITLEDKGIYQCIVQNEKDSIQGAAQVQLGEFDPVFHELFKEETMQPGSPVAFTCIAIGNPNPTIKWTLDTMPIKSNHKVVIENKVTADGQVVSTLNIRTTLPEDGGVYACEAANKLGKQTHSARLNIYGSLTARQINPIKLVTGKRVHLNCPFYGYPVDSVFWEKDSVQLPIDIRQVLLSNWTLVIDDVQRTEDSGQYKCTASKIDGQKTTSHIDVSVLVLPKITPFAFQEELLREGMRARIQCVINEGDSPVSIQWKKDGKFIPKELRDITVQNVDEFSSILAIRNINPKHNGNYTCVASNTAGSVSHTAGLYVNGNNQLYTFYLSAQPEIIPFAFQDDQNFKGMRAHITCAVSQGDIPLTFIWEKDGKSDIRGLGANTGSYDRHSSWLSIESVTSKHSGNYTCIVTNEAGRATFTAQLVVQVGPKIDKLSFQDKQVQEGVNVGFMCVLLEGDPPISINWMKDGQLASSLSGVHVVTHNEFSSLLTIAETNSAHNGNYTCTASNPVASATHTAQLKVNVAPKIVPFTFQGDHLFEGVLARVSCVVYQGDLPITIHWEKDGHVFKLNHSDGISIRTVDDFTSILTIDHVLSKHSGNYSCIAKNSAAAIVHTAQLVVKVPPKIVPFSFQSNELVEGMFVRVSCVVSRGDLPLFIIWKKDGHTIQSDHGILIRPVDEYSSDLSIDSVALQHSGNYTCLVSNAAATTSYSAQLNVYVPPRWVKAPDANISVVQGYKIQLDCDASGFPKPSISWLIKDGSSPFSPMKTLSTGNGRTVFTNGTLVIEKADASHENSYFCKASNGIGKGLSRITKLKVLVPPRIANTADKKSVISGQRVSLQCTVDGERPINTTWLINGKPLLAKKYIIKNHDNASTFITELTINKVSQTDDAVFTCQIENKYGKDEANVSVTVQGPPEVPQGVKAISKGDKTVELSWIPPFDGHSPITKYIIEYKTTQGLPQNHTSSSANTQVLFHDLQSSSTYKFTVFAENELGRSEIGGSAEITLAGEAPTGEPQTILVKAQNGKSIRVSWEPPPRDSWNGNILGYHVGFREANSEDPYEYRMLEIPEGYDKGLSFTLSDLKEFTSYNIVVQAFNDYGKGPLSQEVLSMTSEGVPSKAPLAVDCSPTSSQTISVHWQSPPQAFVHGILRGYRILYWTSHSTDGETKLAIQNTTETKVSLRGLAKYSNYSVQVLAYTLAGDGVASEPVFCRTLEDVPSAPQDIKALPSSMDSVLVSWTTPGSPNGIITHYTVYVEDVASKQNKETRYVLQRNSTLYEVRNLKKNQKYGVRVSATTSIGEGPSTQLVEASISGNTAPARIAAFGEVIKQQINKPVVFSCPAVGIPTPRRTWLFRGQPISTNSRISIHPDGSLQIKLIYLSDNGNYTCHVVNDLGQEQISYLIIVKVAPTAPTLVVTTTTDTTVEIQWKPPTDGNSPVLGYTLSYKQDFATTWQKVDLQPYLSIHKIGNLQCGTTYQAHLVAINEVGIGQPSDTIAITTTGGVPSIPTMDQLIEVSSAHAILHLDSWSANGCPILYFVVEYKPHAARSWFLVSNNLRPEKPSLVLENLEPNTRYSLRMTAHTSAGSVIAEHDFSTFALSEDPMSDDDGRMGTGGLLSFLSTKVVVPTIICALVILLCLVATCFWVSHKKSRRNSVGKKGNQQKSKGHPAVKRNNGSHIQIGNEDSDDEISPYAMVKLSDFQHNQIRPSDARPSSSGFSGTPGRPVISHNYNPTAPPMSESYSPHPRGINQLEHGRKYPILQGQPLYAMPNKKEVMKPLRESALERNDSDFPAPPNDEETIFVFPPPPDDQDGEYDPPPPVIDWLPSTRE